MDRLSVQWVFFAKRINKSSTPVEAFSYLPSGEINRVFVQLFGVPSCCSNCERETPNLGVEDLSAENVGS